MESQKWQLTIDKLTNSIEEAATEKSLHTEVFKLEKSDLRLITPEVGWLFDWQKEFKRTFKLVIKNDTTIQGLISLEDRGDHLFLPLIESAPHNLGKNKKYRGVPGNLTAFACKRSFEIGYKGTVAFVAKTTLIEHYRQALGATVLVGQRMCIEGEAAKNLVSLYYKDFLL